MSVLPFISMLRARGRGWTRGRQLAWRLRRGKRRGGCRTTFSRSAFGDVLHFYHLSDPWCFCRLPILAAMLRCLLLSGRGNSGSPGPLILIRLQAGCFSSRTGNCLQKHRPARQRTTSAPRGKRRCCSACRWARFSRWLKAANSRPGRRAGDIAASASGRSKRICASAGLELSLKPQLNHGGTEDTEEKQVLPVFHALTRGVIGIESASH